MGPIAPAISTIIPKSRVMKRVTPESSPAQTQSRRVSDRPARMKKQYASRAGVWRSET